MNDTCCQAFIRKSVEFMNSSFRPNSLFIRVVHFCIITSFEEGFPSFRTLTCCCVGSYVREKQPRARILKSTRKQNVSQNIWERFVRKQTCTMYYPSKRGFCCTQTYWTQTRRKNICSRILFVEIVWYKP